MILNDHSIIELENTCSTPEDGFEVDGAELVKYIDCLFATWHTHPGTTSNLSVGDYQSFLNYPDIKHYIIGDDGISEYIVENGKVLIAKDDLSPRLLESPS